MIFFSWKVFWGIVIILGCFLLMIALQNRIIFDVSRLSPTIISEIVKPSSVDELQRIICTTDKPIAIAGGKFSQGGQIAYPDGLIIDTTGLNHIINFDLKNKRITVEPGVLWRDIQKLIDPYNLSIKVMQSYNDFTVGGSLSVNVHGRDPYGSLIKTVESIKLLLADGCLIEASRDKHNDLFRAAIGGYGLIGIIVEATLSLTDNEKIERKVQIIPLQNYPEFFFTQVHNNKNVVFHNANIYPNDFNEVLSITWYKTDQAPTDPQRLQVPGLYIKEKLEEQLLRRISPLKKLRKQIEPKRLQEKAVVWRNYEMSYSVEALEPLVRFPTTSILQEYFVPVTQLITFIDRFKRTAQQYNINVINVSIRYVPKDEESLLAYAPRDSFALVCYINVMRTIQQKKEQKWTQMLIDEVLALGGTYYLPYHLYATKEQFQKAYPQLEEFIRVEKKYDPQNRFVNLLYKKYMASN
jgi:FAD/FMN-containing dehydrogenase